MTAPKSLIISSCVVDFDLSTTLDLVLLVKKREKDAQAIWELFKVLFGDICGNLCFMRLWACSLLEVQEGVQVDNLFTFLQSVYLQLPSSSVPCQDCSWLSQSFCYRLEIWFHKLKLEKIFNLSYHAFDFNKLCSKLTYTK